MGLAGGEGAVNHLEAGGRRLSSAWRQCSFPPDLAGTGDVLALSLWPWPSPDHLPGLAAIYPAPGPASRWRRVT